MLAFWTANGLIWWGVYSFGIVKQDELIWFSIACFLFTWACLIALLFSGKYANRKKRHHEFLIEKIADFHAKA